MSKNNIIKSLVIAIAILVVALVFTQQCCRGTEKEVDVYIHDTTYVKVDSIVYTETTKNIVSIKKEYIEVPVYVNCDSLKKEHYAKVYYENNYGTDSTVSITVNSIVQKNELVEEDVSYQILQPIEIHETTVTYDTCKECKQFNIGIGGLIGGYTDKFGAGGSIMLTTNKKASYSVSYDAINKIGYVGIYWNIR